VGRPEGNAAKLMPVVVLLMEKAITQKTQVIQSSGRDVAVH
jgi:hypothetical protein